ncbi:MAG TPA: phosphoribosyltransferase family protein [Chloroflexota bacterium]|nr:phosphoribosyltransferase family protein [Chloroflexota bacterium]
MAIQVRVGRGQGMVRRAAARPSPLVYFARYMSAGDVTNLWLAEALFRLGGVKFGSFTVGRSTVNSPIYIDPKVLLREPRVLARVAQLIKTETELGLAMREPRFHSFDLVAGVPYGGLHLATAYSLASDVPMIYGIPPRQLDGEAKIEGRYKEGETVLVIDDLMTTGGSLLETLSILKGAGLIVHDAIVLVDRGQGGVERLKRHNLHLVPLLNLTQILNFYVSRGLIGEADYRRSLEYVRTHQHDAAAEADGE